MTVIYGSNRLNRRVVVPENGTAVIAGGGRGGGGGETPIQTFTFTCAALNNGREGFSDRNDGIINGGDWQPRLIDSVPATVRGFYSGPTGFDVNDYVWEGQTFTQAADYFHRLEVIDDVSGETTVLLASDMAKLLADGNTYWRIDPQQQEWTVGRTYTVNMYAPR